MVKKIRIYPDSVLRDKAKDVKKFLEAEKILGDMWETMYTFGGIGLAAPQIGLRKRIFIGEVDDEKVFLVNPRIIYKEGKDTMEEGCLSLPKIYLPVNRAYYVEVEGQDEKGKSKIIKAEGLLARVIQHEFDHLEGVLIIDYTKPSKRIRLEKNLKKTSKEGK